MCDTHGVNTRQQKTCLMKKAVTMNDICLNGGGGGQPALWSEALQELNMKQFKNWFDYRCLLSLLPPAPSFRSHLTCSACVSYHHGNRDTREKWRRKKVRETKTEWIICYFFFLFFAATCNYLACAPAFKRSDFLHRYLWTDHWCNRSVRLQCKHFSVRINHWARHLPQPILYNNLSQSSMTVT